MSANARIDTIFQENKELITLKNPSAQAHECLLNELTGINMGWSSQKRLEVIINLGYLSKDLAPSDFDSLWNNLKDFWSPAGSASHFSHTNHHHQRKKFTREHMDVFNAGDTSSGKNIPGPPGNRTPIPLLSPLACHPAPLCSGATSMETQTTHHYSPQRETQNVSDMNTAPKIGPMRWMRVNFLVKLATMALLHLITGVEHHTPPLNRWAHSHH